MTTLALHPGRIATALADAAGLTGPGSTFVSTDKVELPAATILYLAAGKANWLSGRRVIPLVQCRLYAR